MNHSIQTNRPTSASTSNEWCLVARAVTFLALLTSILYLRVILVEGLAAMKASTLTAALAAEMVLLLLATLSLLIALRWQGMGGGLALLGGLCLGIMMYRSQPYWAPTIFYSSPFIVSGGLCLACWWHNRRGQR